MSEPIRIAIELKRGCVNRIYGPAELVEVLLIDYDHGQTTTAEVQDVLPPRAAPMIARTFLMDGTEPRNGARAEFVQGQHVSFRQRHEIVSCGLLIIPSGAQGVIVSGAPDEPHLLGVEMGAYYPALAEWDNVVWLDSEIQPHNEVIQ